MKSLITKLTALVVLSFFALGCVKTVEKTWVVYDEEGCLPPWVSSKNDNKSRNNLEALLKGEGIIPLKIKIEGSRDSDCIDCTCKTGKIYRVQIDESQLERIYYYGFISD